MVELDALESLIVSKPMFVEKLLAHLELSNQNYMTYESALIIISHCTCCEKGKAVAIFIENGLLELLTGTLKLQGNMNLVSKALWALSNIACDDP